MHIHARRALLILTGINLLNYVDRYLIAAVMPAMSSELKLSNTTAGLIMSAFMIGYFLTSPFFGYLADRFSRLKIILGGTIAWSLATAASGFCKSATQILLSRVAVGVGEASTVSTSQALLSDYYPSEKRNKVLGVYLAAVPVGAALGYIIGGLLTEHWGWRSAFLVAGFPGIAVACLIYFLSEPPRAIAENHQNSSHLSQFKKDIAELLKNKTYMTMVWGYTCYTFMLGGVASWVPQYMVNVRGESLAHADSLFGGITVVTGIFGSLAGGAMGTRFLKLKVRGDLQMVFWLVALSAPMAILSFSVKGNWLFWGLITVTEFLLFASQPTVNVIFMESVRPSLKSLALSFSVFMIHLFGDLVSPPIVGFLADHIGLRNAIFILPLALIPSAYFYFRGYKRYQSPSVN